MNTVHLRSVHTDRVGKRWIADGQAVVPILSLLGFAALNAHAQVDATTSSALASTPSPTAPASDNAGQNSLAVRGFSISTSVSVSETATDNATLSSGKRSDFITQVTPAISIRSNAGRVQGFVKYSLSALHYARGTGSSTIQHALDSAIKAEAIDNFAFVDASASVSRQNISPLGTQSPDSSLRTDNQTEVSTVSVSPYLRGRLAGFAAYEARLNYAITRTGIDSIGNSKSGGGSLHLGSDQGQSRLGWSLDGYSQTLDFNEGRRTETRRGVATLIYTPVPDIRVSLRGGREYNNILSTELQGSTTYGGGLRWTPSERTNVSAQFDRRYFGNAHSVTFEHRTPQTVWAYVNSRDASSDPTAASRAPLFTQFNLIYLQLTSKYPDPLERARQTLIQLQTLGVNPFAVAPSGFLTSAVSLRRNQSVSFGYLGLRTTLVVSAQQSDTQRLDELSSATDSLFNNNAIRQRGLSLGASHRMTPITTVSLNVGLTRNTNLVSGSKVALVSFTGGYGEQIGARTFVSLAARRSISGGDASGYNESALTATLTMQF